ncbi:MFS transporter [Streptomyces sp. NPDC057682]|uniref:MFS transporter n=1 Tax=Streptomyces sp. NPDC057682 TaxID=3346210 RepID=UPI00369F8717
MPASTSGTDATTAASTATAIGTATGTPPPPSPHGPGSPGPRPGSDIRRTVALVLCIVTILLALLDSNIVSSATVPIVHDLDPVHGVDRIPWLIAAYQLAATAALPLYGKLCDTLGSKRVLIGALATFLTGSALCGAARSMGELIAARALQGIGGGGLMSITMVVLHQLGTEDEASGKGPGRGGNLGGIVAGAGMAIGPWLGGVLADHAGWRWIFFVNLPVGLAVLATAVVVLKPPTGTSRHRIDFLGAGLAAAFSTTLLLVTQWGGQDYAWSSPQIIGLLTAAVATLALFLRRQATAAEPILPLGLFSIRPVRYGFAIQGLAGVAMMGSIVYVMIYLQVVRGVPATSAGLFLVPMAIGMTVIGLASGRLVALGWSQKTFVVSGAACASAALALLATLGTDTGLWTVRATMLVLGLGFGQLIGQLIQLVQNKVPAGRLGVATTGLRFFQTLGTALGASVFGTLLSRMYASRGPGGTTSDIAGLTGSSRRQALEAFTTSTHLVFGCAAAVMATALVLAVRLPGATRDQTG